VRVVLITGKGGVGKTTTAAATALGCAARGHRTLVMSTDPAHSLGDAFGADLGDSPVALATRLDGLQLDPQDRLEHAWGDVRAYLTRVLDWAGIDGVQAEELAVLPGFDELFSLTELETRCASGDYDVIVVDCAPTAETLRLLSLPEVLGRWIDRLFPLGRNVVQAIAPVTRALAKGLPLPEDDTFDALERLYQRLRAVRSLLADPATTTVRLVVTPERMVVAEGRRLATYLALFGYRVDAVIANRVLPEAVVDPFFAGWRSAQAEQLAVIEEGFAPITVLRAGLAEAEIFGLERLRAFAEQLYGDDDPSVARHAGCPLTIERAAPDRWVLSLELPFAERGDLQLSRRHDELLLRVGAHRRAVLLPDSLRRRAVVDASLRDGILSVVFAEVGA
jgi:arsenite/tail-anchored protein-transporting ATPase